MFSLMKRTLPSAMANMTPPSCMLDAERRIVAAEAELGGFRPATASLIMRFEPVAEPYQRFRPTIPVPPPSSLFETSQAVSDSKTVFVVPSVISEMRRVVFVAAVTDGCLARMKMPFEHVAPRSLL